MTTLLNEIYDYRKLKGLSFDNEGLRHCEDSDIEESRTIENS